MREIETEKDVEELVHSFYSLLRKDEMVSHFFNDVIEIDWDVHMPRICDFWKNILLDLPVYQGNAMIKHIELDRISKIENRHIDRWMELWKSSIDTYFSGSNADLAKERAHQIVELMKFKINGNSQFI